MINGKKVALVLGGGASKGFAHVGVIKVLEQNGIVPDIIVGTSMGSLIGGFYASGMPVEEIEKQCVSLKFKDFVDVNVFNIIKQGMVTGKKLIKFVDRLSNNALIENSKIKFACVSCDIKTGKEYVFREGKLSTALRASSAVPALFAPLKHKGMLLVDGGVVNNIPTSVAKSMGADYIISVDCVGNNYIMGEIKTFLDIMMSSFNILQHEYEKIKRNSANTKIVVKNENYGFVELKPQCVQEIIGLGARAAKKKMSKIKKDLKII